MNENDMMAALAKALQPHLQKASGTPDFPVDIYGAGGLFGVCGANDTLINAMVGPLGVERILRWMPSIDDNPLYDSLVSIGTTTNAQSSGCADCGKPVLKECVQTFCFGRVCQQTNEAQADSLGMRMNQGVPRLALFGDVKDAGGNVLVARGQQITDRFTLDLAAASYNLRLDMSTLNIVGNPANNAGGRLQPTGLQLIVNTGKVDALTNTACPALDSFLIDFQNNVVGALGAPSIVAYVTAALHQVQYRLQGAGFSQDGATSSSSCTQPPGSASRAHGRANTRSSAKRAERRHRAWMKSHGATSGTFRPCACQLTGGIILSCSIRKSP